MNEASLHTAHVSIRFASAPALRLFGAVALGVLSVVRRAVPSVHPTCKPAAPLASTFYFSLSHDGRRILPNLDEG